jgi:hypothetical protein
VPAGTRIAVALAEPLVVGPGGAPVVATTSEDVPGEDGILVSRGTRLVGEARVGADGERATIAFSTLVVHGHSVALSGLALGPDNELGVRGKVLRKASGGRRGLGKALHAVGSALSFGILGSGSAGEEAATQAAAGELEGLDRNDHGAPVLEIPKGSFSVFVRADLTLP